ncbi:MAG: hypothetical protein PHF46_02220, partial [Candidatus Gracilibacteria bacterium]|nr:hypothetical protein [Candidatus Gracilibacteria bacterium]
FVDPSGREKKIIIFWGEDYLSHELLRFDGKDAFKKKAEAYRDYLIFKGGNANNIIVADGTTFSNWQNALENNGKIKRIVYYGHSGDGGLYLRDRTPNDLSDNHIASLESIVPSNWDQDFLLTHYDDGSQDHRISELNTSNATGAGISLYGCNSSSMAKDFAKQFKGIATGSNSSIHYNNDHPFGVEYIPYTEGNSGWSTYNYKNQ